MYQLDEKLMADNRAIISIAPDKARIEPNLKPGMQAFETDKKDTYVVASEKKYHRLIQEDAYTNKIHYDLTFAGNITVEKDLIVKGNLTNLETEDLVVKDNIIELNKDEKGNGITKGSSGIEINRGQKNRARILFSEATDRTSTSGFLFNIGSDNIFYIYENGDIKTSANINANNANISNNLIVGNDLTVNNNSYLKGTLDVTNATTLNSTLNVKNTSTLEGAVTLKSTLTVNGGTDLKSTLKIAGATTLNNTFSVTGNVSALSNVDISGDTTIAKTLSVTGATTLKSTLNVTESTTLNSTLKAIDAVTFDNTLTVKGAGIFQSTVDITDKLSTTSIGNTGLITTKTLSVTESANVGTTLDVKGATTLNGAATLNSTLDVMNDTVLHNKLEVKDETTLNDLTVNESTYLKNVLTVEESTSLNSTLLVKNKATFSDNVEVEKNTSLNGTLTVGNNSYLSSASLSGNLSVSGETNLNRLKVTGDVSFTGPADIVNLRAETLTLYSTRNALKWNNGSETHMLYGAGTAEVGRGYTLFAATTNDYNVIFKSDKVSGKERGFVYVSGTTPVFQINETAVRSANDIYVKRGTDWSLLLANADKHKSNHAIGGHDFLSPVDIGAVKNTKSTPELLTDNESAKPAASLLGRIFFAKDTKRIWQDLGNTWQIIGGQDTIAWDNVTNKPATFTPPIATSNVLGGVKIGNNILVDPDGTIHVPKQTIEYTVHVEEFKATSNQTTFTLSKAFLMGRNHVSPFLYGRRIPPSAYTEKDDRTIVFKQGLPEGALLEFYVLLIPADLSFVMKIEEFYVASGQTNFILSKGKYTVGSNKLKVYLNGALMPRSAYSETSSSSISLKQTPGVGNHILIEYMYDPLAE